MESLSETKWDVVISGTGLQQSLLALALSRSGKKVLHVDPNEFYGAAEAALSLQEADEWAEKHRSGDSDAAFAAAEVIRAGEGLSFSRAYSIALAPQLIHTKSDLLSQLVSSKAFRQVEFLAVGSFYIFQPSEPAGSRPSLNRIPSTREDVFSNTVIPARSKRSLMKFLKFVLAYDVEPNTDLWSPRRDEPLVDFLASEFKLDERLRAYVITLTLSLDGAISVGAGLAAINRHMASMGLFGPGFAAVYPKWGGLSEIAQVGCRAGAVGGAVYMLGTGITDVQVAEESTEDLELPLAISLSNDVSVKAKTLVQDSSNPTAGVTSLSRLTAVVNSGLSPTFEATVEGTPTPAISVVAFPTGYVTTDDGEVSEFPIYAMLHSSDTGECPKGQCVIYLSTVFTSSSRGLLEKALSSLLAAVADDPGDVTYLYKLHFEQRGGSASVDVNGPVVGLPSLPVDLSFNDSVMDRVRAAWEVVMKGDEPAEGTEYMKFDDREGAADDDRYD
ncbi:Rab proteins geranylgeranyltransferase component A [Amphichorda felina]